MAPAIIAASPVVFQLGTSPFRWSRRGALFNDRFPRIAEAVGALPADNALIDGEAVVFLPDGHSDFAGLLTKAGGEQASLVAFDILALKGDDLRQHPLEERRDALSRLVAGVGRLLHEVAGTRLAPTASRPRPSSFRGGRGMSHVLPAILGATDDIGKWVGTITEPLRSHDRVLHRTAITLQDFTSVLSWATPNF